MSRYQPIYKEISVESMRYMREEEHMNNREIAERLGISTSTVHKYLGSMSPELRAEFKRAGGRMSAAQRWAGAQPTQRVPVPTPQEEPDAVLLVMDRTVRLSGDTADYEINCSERTVKRYPKESGIALTIDLDKLPTMIAELSAINRKLDALTVTTEMW